MSSVDFSRLSSVRNLLNLSQDFDNHKKVVAHGPYGVHDTMRVGMRSIAHELAPQHPLQLSLQTIDENVFLRRNTASAMSLGMYAGLRHEFESRIASEGTRLPTCYVPSSNLAINNVNGTEDTIDSCDFLNVAFNSPNASTDAMFAI